MIHLESGPLACDIVPELGACIAGLWREGEPVLRSTPGAALDTSRRSGCYPLVPFSNRVGQATLEWDGTRHPLVRNNGEETHAIHGVGWQRPWMVLDSDEQSALLAYQHRPDASWPFAFDCSQAFRLSPGALDLSLSMTNQSGKPAPAGLGWHPYFVKRPGSRISFTAAGRWEMGRDKLPTRRLPAPGLDADCEGLDIDHCFDGWAGSAELRDARMHVRLQASLSRLVVFTNASRDFVAIEPVSHVNNAINRVAAGADAAALGLVVLAPGETMNAHLRIEVEPAR